jgi:citrate synthase
MQELAEVQTKFQGHYMTKLNKQLKAEKEELEGRERQQAEQIKALLSQNSNNLSELERLRIELLEVSEMKRKDEDGDEERNGQSETEIISLLKEEVEELR